MIGSMMNQKLAFVGDIHGDATRLRTALADSRLSGRRLVFLGDYVDRGPDSRNVIEQLLYWKGRRPDWTFLEGNHDAALRGLLDGTTPPASFIACGGAATVRSYVDKKPRSISAMLSAFPADHRDFLGSLESYCVAGDIVASHAGIPCDSAWSVINGIRVTNPWHLEKMGETRWHFVFGHYPQAHGRPYVTRRIACLDTGCGHGGPLTVLLSPEWQFLQF
ncbi:metallophosphoesterase [Thiocapsa bogorovii]|uniref:metallophosphoesterase n=1 Tax=Thiocapsa bogorovii TaxID=521689 RepID=UPI0038CDC0A1